MVQKSLIDYIKGLLQKGYQISTIRDVLLKHGYTNKDVEDALNSIYHPTIRHEIHLSGATILVIVFIFVSLLSAGIFFYFSGTKAPTKLLDLNLEPVTMKVKPGENIVFVKELSNLGSSKRYDVVIEEEVIDVRTNNVLIPKTETRAIETFGSTQTRILIPTDIKPGTYLLRVTIEYDDKKAIATLPVEITGGEAKESCFDNIKNQNEEGIDCGWQCKPCQKQLECNDNDPCTNDAIENNVCVNKPIVPCCGNGICEEQENCPADCQKTEPSSTETLDGIKELAKSNPSKALQQCNKVDVPDLKDQCIGNIGEVQRNKNYCAQITNQRIKDICYSKIAESIKDMSLCREISEDGRRDSCYLTFALDYKDFSGCDKITNKYHRQSCDSLRQLNELNQQ